MKQSSSTTSVWQREFVLPWKPRSNFTRGGPRRLPTTLSSMQIIFICGFAFIVLLRNTVTVTSGGFSWSSQLIPEVETNSHSLATFRSGLKRHTGEIKEKDAKEQGVHKQIIIDRIPVKSDHKTILKQSDEDELVRKSWKENGVQENMAVEKEKVDVEAETKIVDDNVEEEKNSKIAREDPEEKNIDPGKSKGDPQLQEEQNSKSESSQQQLQRKLEAEVKAEEMWMPTWMPSGFAPKSLGPNPKNWDEQRTAWLQKYPHMKLNSEGKPRMLLVTGSSPWPCANPVGDHYYLKYIKNKIDYCRQHNIEIFYNAAHLDKEMSSYWAKLPILRKLMLSHPEIEWFFWMDADAIFTDMLFEIPMEDYKDYNLVMWGYDSGFYGEKSWVAINNGVFFLRNCQWSLDLFDMWAPMGPEGTVRDEAGKMLTSFMTKRPEMPADDQSALGYLILTKEELQPKVKLVWEYELSGYWADHVTHYEEYMIKDHPRLGDKRWPFTTHFTGCQPCSGHPNPAYDKLDCVKHMERAFNFADNQVLQMLGFMHESLDSVVLKRIKEEDDHPLDNVRPNTWITASQSFGL